MAHSRGPFNNTCSIYHQAAGVRDALPYVTGVPCRYVIQNQIYPDLYPQLLRTAWITLDAVSPVRPTHLTLGTLILVEYGNADLFILDSDPGMEWVTLMNELVTPTGEPNYERVWVGPKWW